MHVSGCFHAMIFFSSTMCNKGSFIIITVWFSIVEYVAIYLFYIADHLVILVFFLFPRVLL